MNKTLTITITEEFFKSLKHEINVKLLVGNLFIKDSNIDKLSALLVRAIERDMDTIKIIDNTEYKQL